MHDHSYAKKTVSSKINRKTSLKVKKPGAKKRVNKIKPRGIILGSKNNFDKLKFYTLNVGG